MVDHGPCGTRPGNWYVYYSEWVVKRAMEFGRYYYSDKARFERYAENDGLTLEQCQSFKPPKKAIRKYGLEVVKPLVLVRSKASDLVWMIQPYVLTFDYAAETSSEYYSYESALDLHKGNLGIQDGRTVVIDW